MWNRPLFLKQGAFALTNANAKGSLRSAWAFLTLKRLEVFCWLEYSLSAYILHPKGRSFLH